MGKSIEITRQENTASELRRFAGKTEDGGQVRRLLGGRARGEAAAASGMDRQILCDWVHRYNAAWVAGLATGTRPGRPPSLNEVQMAELKELVIKGPDPELHKVVRWRCVDLCEEVARRYSVKVTKGTTCVLISFRCSFIASVLTADNGGTYPAGRADRAEQIDRVVPIIPHRGGP